MEGVMVKKYEMILSAEEALARQVAIGVIVTQPLTVWHYLIPFMFIFDFLKRRRVIQLYTNQFMFPRKIAIDAARRLTEGEDRKERLSWVEEQVRVWLESLGIYSESLQQAQTRVVGVLVEHYERLLRAEGLTHDELVRDAYVHRGEYEAHISRLASLEKELDRAIMDKLGETEKLRDKLLAEERQLQRMRQKRIDQIF